MNELTTEPPPTKVEQAALDLLERIENAKWRKVSVDEEHRDFERASRILIAASLAVGRYKITVTRGGTVESASFLVRVSGPWEPHEYRLSQLAPGLRHAGWVVDGKTIGGLAFQRSHLLSIPITEQGELGLANMRRARDTNNREPCFATALNLMRMSTAFALDPKIEIEDHEFRGFEQPAQNISAAQAVVNVHVPGPIDNGPLKRMPNQSATKQGGREHDELMNFVDELHAKNIAYKKMSDELEKAGF